MDFLKNQKKTIIIIVLFALVISFLLELAFWRVEESYAFSSDHASAMDPGVCQVLTSGYQIDSQGKYTLSTSDPQIMLMNVNLNVKTVLMTFQSRIFTSPRCQVFYSAGEDFSEEKSFFQSVPIGTDRLIFSLPEGEIKNVRIDIDGEFSLENIFVTSGTVSPTRTVVAPFSMLRVLLIFLLLAIVGLLFLNWILSKNPRRLSRYEFIFVLVMFLVYFVWAVSKGFDYAPDEAMRYDVTKFLFDHNRLPINDELKSVWGFSYAHLPTVLCNQVGYVFMKLTSVFSTNSHTLLIAARMVSVLACTGTVYVIIKMTKLIFNTPTRWVAIVAVAWMPQFAFLGSYVNNDSIAVFGITVILYSWMLGMKDRWNFKNAALLVIGLSVCILSYYNSYGWVLLSVIFFVVSYLYQNKKDYKGMFKFAGIIACATFLLAGHIFIRHLVLYGDLLGFRTLDYYGELYAVDSLLPSNRPSIFEQGLSLKEMLVDRGWLRSTLMSFVAGFGYMNVFPPAIVYFIVSLFILVAVVGCILELIRRILKKQKPDRLNAVFYSFLIIGSLIAIAFSIYNSYCSDFQPQGRYCYPAFPAMAIFAAWGYEGVLRFFKKESHKYAMVAMACTAFVALSLFVFYTVYLPS